MAFDARAARTLLPDDYLTVDDCPGLRLVASAKFRTWTYRYEAPDGRKRQMRLGRWPLMSIADAMAAWAVVRDKRMAGADPAVDRREAKRQEEMAQQIDRMATYSVRECIADYLREHIDVNRKARGASYTRHLLESLPDEFLDRPVQDIERSDAFRVIIAMQSTAVTAKRVRSELGAAWDHAVDAARVGGNTPNWWRQILRGKLRSQGMMFQGARVGVGRRVLDDSELASVLAWLPNFSPLMRDALTLYLWTGTRGAEILAVDAAEVREEADGWWWTIPKAKTKNARILAATDLRVPLIGRALEVVRRRVFLYGKGFLFPTDSPSGHTDQKTISANLYYHQPYSNTRPNITRPRLPDMPRWSPHDLRRTARTKLAALGCPDDVAEAVIGHVQGGIRAVYNRHQYDAERRKWLKRLDAELERLSAKGVRRD